MKEKLICMLSVFLLLSMTMEKVDALEGDIEKTEEIMLSESETRTEDDKLSESEDEIEVDHSEDEIEIDHSEDETEIDHSEEKLEAKGKTDGGIKRQGEHTKIDKKQTQKEEDEVVQERKNKYVSKIEGPEKTYYGKVYRIHFIEDLQDRNIFIKTSYSYETRSQSYIDRIDTDEIVDGVYEAEIFGDYVHIDKIYVETEDNDYVMISPENQSEQSVEVDETEHILLKRYLDYLKSGGEEQFYDLNGKTLHPMYDKYFYTEKGRAKLKDIDSKYLSNVNDEGWEGSIYAAIGHNKYSVTVHTEFNWDIKAYKVTTSFGLEQMYFPELDVLSYFLDGKPQEGLTAGLTFSMPTPNKIHTAYVTAYDFEGNPIYENKAYPIYIYPYNVATNAGYTYLETPHLAHVPLGGNSQLDEAYVIYPNGDVEYFSLKQPGIDNEGLTLNLNDGDLLKVFVRHPQNGIFIRQHISRYSTEIYDQEYLDGLLSDISNLDLELYTKETVASLEQTLKKYKNKEVADFEYAINDLLYALYNLELRESAGSIDSKEEVETPKSEQEKDVNEKKKNEEKQEKQETLPETGVSSNLRFNLFLITSGFYLTLKGKRE